MFMFTFGKKTMHGNLNQTSTKGLVLHLRHLNQLTMIILFGKLDGKRETDPNFHSKPGHWSLLARISTRLASGEGGECPKDKQVVGQRCEGGPQTAGEAKAEKKSAGSSFRFQDKNSETGAAKCGARGGMV